MTLTVSKTYTCTNMIGYPGREMEYTGKMMKRQILKPKLPKQGALILDILNKLLELKKTFQIDSSKF